MKLTKKQYRKIEHLMPNPRKPPEISNYQFLCALLYIIENGCKWRALPKKYGKWHTIYMKFNRWSKNGTIQRIFKKCKNLISLMSEQIRFVLTVQASKFILTQQVPASRMVNRVSGVQKGADNETASVLCF